MLGEAGEMTALMLACKDQQVEVALLLIEAGAEVSARVRVYLQEEESSWAMG
jgi:ankyrin repeat protein